jgi:hypothetical protein
MYRTHNTHNTPQRTTSKETQEARVRLKRVQQKKDAQENNPYLVHTNKAENPKANTESSDNEPKNLTLQQNIYKYRWYIIGLVLFIACIGAGVGVYFKFF